MAVVKVWALPTVYYRFKFYITYILLISQQLKTHKIYIRKRRVRVLLSGLFA